MEHLVRSLKVLWRSELLLRQNEFRLSTQKIQFNALAALVAVFGLVMLGLASFFALVPYWGNAMAALIVGGTDLVLAGLMVTYARSLKPAAEVEMVKEMRDMALNDIHEEIAQAEADLVTLKDDVHKFVRNPVDALLPGVIGPLLGAVTRGLGSSKK